MQKRAFITTTAIIFALTGCATSHVPPDASSLDDLARTYWGVPNYEFGKDQVIQTTIPHDRLTLMKNRLDDLSSLCDRQGGSWQYLGGPSKNESSTTRNAGSVRPSLSESATKEDMNATVKTAEAAVAGDVLASTLIAMQSIPDPETREAISRAERLQWLGRFECSHETKSWTAELRFNRTIRMSNEGIVYRRDIVIDTVLRSKR